MAANKSQIWPKVRTSIFQKCLFLTFSLPSTLYCSETPCNIFPVVLAIEFSGIQLVIVASRLGTDHFLWNFFLFLSMQKTEGERVETDTMGELKVPNRSYWGAQTQRYDALEDGKAMRESVKLQRSSWQHISMLNTPRMRVN